MSDRNVSHEVMSRTCEGGREVTSRAKPEPILFSETYRAMHPDKPHVRMSGNGQSVPVAATDVGGGRKLAPDGSACPISNRRATTAVQTNTVNSSVPIDERPRAETQMARVMELMRLGEWWTLAELAKEAGGTEAAVSARCRDLRNLHGWTVERRPVPGSNGLRQYRGIPPASV